MRESSIVSGRLVGVLGGTGPAATAYFLQRLVERTEARCDQDHVRTLAFNDTAVPDRTAFLLGRSDRSPLEALIEDGRLLEACGCDLLALPCNTAHGFFDELQGALGIPVVHMVRETAAAASAVGLARIGVLATSGTVAARPVRARGRTARRGLPLSGRDDPGAGEPRHLRRSESRTARGCGGTRAAGGAVPRRWLRWRGARVHRAVFGLRRRDAGGRTSVVDALDVLADCVIMRAGRPSKTSKNLSLQN